MPEIVIDGFRFSKWAYGRQLLIVESDRLQECIRYCNKKRVKHLHISPYHGYQLNNVDFLAECHHVIGIHLQGGKFDLSGLYGLKNLEKLSAIFDHRIDFALIPGLVDIATDWNPKIDDSLFRVKGLRRLWLRGYRPKKYHDLSRFKAIDKLEHLHIALSNIKTLKGIEALHVLRELALSYCRSLEDISELSENTATLQELQIDRCKKARNLEMMLKKLKQLRKIILSHCRDLPSLKFVKQLPKLEFLSFVDTNVLDGDITPCLNLKFVGFMNKRHFSHTFEEVRSIIEKRTNEQNLYSK